MEIWEWYLGTRRRRGPDEAAESRLGRGFPGSRSSGISGPRKCVSPRHRPPPGATHLDAPFPSPRPFTAGPSSASRSRHQRLARLRRQELRQVAAEHGDLPQQRTADVRELLLRHQEHRLDLRVEVQVHQRHGELVLHVAERPQPADHEPRPDRPRTKRTASPSNVCTSTFRVRLRHRLEQLDPLLDAEERRLVRVDADADDEPVAQLAAALDDVQVAEVDRVEHAGVHGLAGGKRGCIPHPTASRKRSISSVGVVGVRADPQPAGADVHDHPGRPAPLHQLGRRPVRRLQRHDARPLVARPGC